MKNPIRKLEFKPKYKTLRIWAFNLDIDNKKKRLLGIDLNWLWLEEELESKVLKRILGDHNQLMQYIQKLKIHIVVTLQYLFCEEIIHSIKDPKGLSKILITKIDCIPFRDLVRDISPQQQQLERHFMRKDGEFLVKAIKIIHVLLATCSLRPDLGLRLVELILKASKKLGFFQLAAEFRRDLCITFYQYKVDPKFYSSIFAEFEVFFSENLIHDSEKFSPVSLYPASYPICPMLMLPGQLPLLHQWPCFGFPISSDHKPKSRYSPPTGITPVTDKFSQNVTNSNPVFNIPVVPRQKYKFLKSPLLLPVIEPTPIILPQKYEFLPKNNGETPFTKHNSLLMSTSATNVSAAVSPTNSSTTNIETPKLIIG